MFFITGAQGTFLITFGLSVELVGNERKTLVGNLTQGWFAIGEALVGCLAFAFTDWRSLQVSFQIQCNIIVEYFFHVIARQVATCKCEQG